MDFTKSNKEAWEEAFCNRSKDWSGEDIKGKLKDEKFSFLEKVLTEELAKYDYQNKKIAQFCCNNGRELFSFMRLGALEGTGFDIAENMVDFANTTAKDMGVNCRFIATDILKIQEEYFNSFDYILITIGALTWFRDLTPLFQKVSQCLKKDGVFFIHETHPVINMLAAPGEDNYDEGVPEKNVNSYFRKEPWVENNGMGYMSKKEYESKDFYSFSHTFSHIINAIDNNCMYVKKLEEYDYDISDAFYHLNGSGIPLSCLMVIKKHE
ncbi:class I SAM-dependent methyltransferase [Anaerocolumna xylanovorans]|uniref:Methyltransferase domain-containing protein n=1 Tax=Anaerocolumna xylanovorans DSM 12503 TaxID=1121345 RepID=A0A1M7YJ70_9FIRM|nr:class I SAM-dependent methyltransferase [Anaerocolumna xylanovorans]SHO52666.1 Methyltransferase domain-containing protein [Anaerocolumna xylanovorans DSM 12503]